MDKVRENNGTKITCNSYCDIFDEIVRKDGLEYDTTHAYAVDYNEYNESNSDRNNDEDKSKDEEE